MTDYGYDFIGDIHGHATELWELLEQLGYKKGEGVYRHRSRKAVFLGDFIDRGPQQVEVLETVREMINRAGALSVMGNHEFNAIGWASAGESGEPLRAHTEKNASNTPLSWKRSAEIQPNTENG